MKNQNNNIKKSNLTAQPSGLFVKGITMLALPLALQVGAGCSSHLKNEVKENEENKNFFVRNVGDTLRKSFCNLKKGNEQSRSFVRNVGGTLRKSFRNSKKENEQSDSFISNVGGTLRKSFRNSKKGNEQSGSNSSYEDKNNAHEFKNLSVLSKKSPPVVIKEVLSLHNERLDDFFKKLFSEKEEIKTTLKEKLQYTDENGKNILHICAIDHSPRKLANLIDHLGRFIDWHEPIKMLLANDNDNKSPLHYMLIKKKSILEKFNKASKGAMLREIKEYCHDKLNQKELNKFIATAGIIIAKLDDIDSSKKVKYTNIIEQHKKNK